jgi:hypothetical protein
VSRISSLQLGSSGGGVQVGSERIPSPLEVQPPLNVPLPDLHSWVQKKISISTSPRAVPFPLRLGLYRCWFDAYFSPIEVYVSALGLEITFHLEEHAGVDENPMRGGLALKQRQYTGLIHVCNASG